MYSLPCGKCGVEVARKRNFSATTCPACKYRQLQVRGRKWRQSLPKKPPKVRDPLCKCGNPKYLENAVCRECYNAKYRRKHSTDERRAYMRAYKKAHPEYGRHDSKVRRARKKGAEGHFSMADWRAISARQQNRCAACELLCNLTVDHIIPLSRGGSNWPSNLQGLCNRCNASKNDRTMEEWRRAA